MKQIPSEVEVPNQQILEIQDELKVNNVRRDKNSTVNLAANKQMIPPHRRSSHVPTDSDHSLAPAQSYQQVLLDSKDAHGSDSGTSRVEESNTAY
jgi:hypothetical protein